MKRLIKKSSVLETIMIILAIVGITVIIKPIILSVANIDDINIFNLNKLTSAITQTATNTVPAVTNGGSTSVSSGGSGIKSIQTVVIDCFVYSSYASTYNAKNPKSYSIKTVDPNKVQVSNNYNSDLDYTITNNAITLSAWSSYIFSSSSGSYSGLEWYYCHKYSPITAIGMGNSSAKSVETDVKSRYLPNKLVVQLTEYY